MNKTQIITPLIALAIAALVFGISLARSQHRSYVSSRALAIGYELLSTTNSIHLVGLDPELQGKLSQFLVATGALISVAYGDTAPPVGDGSALVRVFLKNSKEELLGLRLRPNAQSDKFEILGYWTPQRGETDKSRW